MKTFNKNKINSSDNQSENGGMNDTKQEISNGNSDIFIKAPSPEVSNVARPSFRQSISNFFNHSLSIVVCIYLIFLYYLENIGNIVEI